MPWIAAALAAVQVVGGVVKNAKANKATKELLKERKPYETPDEVFKILNATQANAQSGYDAETLDYLNNQTDRAFSSAIGASELLGGDPNDLSAIFDQKMQQVMKIGAENHALNMTNFNKYLGALDSVAGNKSAEWQSQQNYLKDDLQAAAAEKALAQENIGNGLNLGLNAASALYAEKLYKDNKGGDTKTEKENAISALEKLDFKMATQTVPNTSSNIPAPNNNSTQGYYDEATGKWFHWDGTEWIRKK